MIMFEVSCPCSCGEVVPASTSGTSSFDTQEVQVAPCTHQASQGIHSLNILHSRAMELAVNNADCFHHNGLVFYGGA